MTTRISFVFAALSISILCTATCNGLNIVEKGPIEWNPSVEPLPPTFTIEIANTTDTDSDNVALWQLDIEVTKSVDAVGSLELMDIVEPTNYLFAGFSTFFESVIGNPQTTAYVDDLLLPTGIPVPAGEQFGLAQLEFSALPDISGTFYVTVLPLPGNSIGSLWTNSSSDVMEFSNVPSSGGAVVVGSIVVVPEPGALDLVLCCSLMCCLWSYWRRNRAIAGR